MWKTLLRMIRFNKPRGRYPDASREVERRAGLLEIAREHYRCVKMLKERIA